LQTITFYSYKGGTGRTLVMANVASYLCRFGTKVFAVDFDLEAPGLLYKFRFPDDKRAVVERGVVDYVLAYQTEGQVPTYLDDYVLEVPALDEPGSIHLMPAGACPSEDYWQKLAQINWYDLFYSDDPRGVSLLLDLKRRIEEQYQPDFLLIDSRTGITEIGGVAASILPDKVVCLMLNNPENLEGAREVLRGIMQAPRMPDAPPIELLPVLTRIPTNITSEEEGSLKTQAKAYLNAENQTDLSRTLSVDEPYVFHSEPELQVRESLRVGARKPEDSPLLRDYLVLFKRLIPADVLQPAVAELLGELTSQVLDSPEEVERGLRALADLIDHPDVYLAMLRLYRLQGRPRKMFESGFRFWKLTGDARDPLLWHAVWPQLRHECASREPVESLRLLRFAAAVWLEAGRMEMEAGFAIAEWLGAMEDLDGAHRVLATMAVEPCEDPDTVRRLVEAFIDCADIEGAFTLVDSYKGKMSANSSFCQAWARLGIASGLADRVLGDRKFSVGLLMEDCPKLAFWLLVKAGSGEAAREALGFWLTRGYEYDDLILIGQDCADAQSYAAFRSALERVAPLEVTKEVLKMVQTSSGR